MASVLKKQQRKTFGPRVFSQDGQQYSITADVRFDDDCGNGHNTFAITGEIRAGGRFEVGGCLHEEIAQHFPELTPFIKWHLCSTDGPMHYVANTMHFASDRDCWGRRAGEPSRFERGVRFGDSPVTHLVKDSFWSFLKDRHGSGNFQVIGIAHEPGKPGEFEYSPNYTFVGFGDKWHECPFRSKVEADEFCEGMNRCHVEFTELATEFSTGKDRELDSARAAAIWPDATDDELMADDLKEKLVARLPGLLADFRAAVESLGLTW